MTSVAAAAAMLAPVAAAPAGLTYTFIFAPGPPTEYSSTAWTPVAVVVE